MKFLVLLIAVLLLTQPVSALDIEPPQMPESAQEYLSGESQTFSEGLFEILKNAISKTQPAIAEAAATCFSLIAVAVLASVLQSFSVGDKGVIGLVTTLSISLLLLQPSNSLLQLGIDTVTELSEYGKLLLPVMAAALAAQGGSTASAALYTGTALFDSLLSTAMIKVLVPMIYVYLVLCIAEGAVSEELIKSMKSTVKWAMTWFLKIVLYVFTGYLSISGVISGTADAAAVKAAKLAMSGTVPVVGSIIADASETVLVSAGFVKNTVGVSGLLAVLGICVGPFIKIGIQYLLLKLTAAVCGMLGTKSTASLVRDFSGAMGLVLAMTGTVCVLFLISTVCFMKGMS